MTRMSKATRQLLSNQADIMLALQHLQYIGLGMMKRPTDTNWKALSDRRSETMELLGKPKDDVPVDGDVG